MGSMLLDDLVQYIPAADLFVQPFMFHNRAVLSAAQARGSPVRDILDRALLTSRGLRVLWWQSVGSGVALSQGAPVAKPADIAGKRVGVFGDTLATWVKLCGGIPVLVSGAEQYSAIKSGRAEIVFSDSSSVVPRKMWEVADTVTITRHYAGAKLIAINERVWQSLSREYRRSIEEAALESEGIAREEDERGDLELAKKNGMSIVEITDDDVREWKYCGVQLIETYLERSGKMGFEMLAGYRKILVDNDKR